MVCFTLQPGMERQYYSFLHKSVSPPQPYLDSALKFLSDIGQEVRTKLRVSVSVIWIMEDEATIAAALIKRLQSSGAVIFAHSVRPEIQNLVTLVPNFHFIDTKGFRYLIDRVQNASFKLSTRDKCVFWRGSTTGLPCAYGIWANCTDTCEGLPRVKAVQASLNTSWLDFKLTSLTQVCVSAVWLHEHHLVSSHEPEESWIRCLGLLEIDGNVDAWGARWRQESDSVIFMVKSNFATYYSNRLQAGIHYIEISGDLSDLTEKTKVITSTADEDVQLLRNLRRNSVAAMKELTYSKAVKEIATTFLL